MDNMRQERLNEGPNLNANKNLHRQSLSKKFGTHVEKSIVFKTFKNKQCVIPRTKVISKGLLIQKPGNISMRYLVYSKKIHC